MNLDLINNMLNIQNNKFIKNFMLELQKYIEANSKKEAMILPDSIDNETKIITEYRDKMLIERSHILNNYAKQTLNKGQMYYIYSKNSKLENGYNLCICEEEKSHVVIEASIDDLPYGAQIGSVLRNVNGSYVIDEDATKDITEKFSKMKEQLLEQQAIFLESARIEGHIYELSEKADDRVWLFDITNESTNALEEIEFPDELLSSSNEGDLFIYKNGEYYKNPPI